MYALCIRKVEDKMLEYSEFYDIAEYGNVAWKGSFTQKEVACNAYIYYADYLWSKKEGKMAHSMEVLCRNLADDLETDSDNMQIAYWLEQLLELA